jgi:hypothetical protein
MSCLEIIPPIQPILAFVVQMIFFKLEIELLNTL